MEIPVLSSGSPTGKGEKAAWGTDNQRAPPRRSSNQGTAARVENQEGTRGLSGSELLRYGRHVSLPELGEAGQLRLKAGSVLIVGAGGLGSPAALYLAAAGVGRIGIADDDSVALSNLQRQVLHGTADLGAAKTASARRRLADLNPEVSLDIIPARVGSSNARALCRDFDVVLDGSDSFATRYLLNDACGLEGRPLVYGSIFRFEGQASVFHAGRGPCYRCLFPEPPPPGQMPNCAEAGVLGVLPGVIGCVQATEAIKLIARIGETLLGRLLVYDALAMRFREFAVLPDAACALCGDDPTITEAVEMGDPVCESGAGRPSGSWAELAPLELDALRSAGRPPLLLDVREEFEWAMCRIEGALLMPMNQIPARLGELDRDAEIVIYCHTGVRSQHVARYLASHGFRSVFNLTGGIRRWSLEVDPSVPLY